MKDERLPAERERKLTAPQKYESKRIDEGVVVADGGNQINEFIELIADKRRRYVLYFLRNRGNTEFEAVTEQVTAWETETPPEELDEQTRRNIRIDLRHSHLPKLEDTGIIRFDRRNGSIYLQHLPDSLEKYLDYCADIECQQ
ncbi:MULTISPECIES: DUF7344 domain-containing protein [Natrialbaceae]|uniref:DUF7344 domain-containing protein n=1 Tax=Natrialbaceae TaxID=1644061 RepID=UPI00207D6291|nr:hypothetical protein [Natronococcus sp. CG52]